MTSIPRELVEWLLFFVLSGMVVTLTLLFVAMGILLVKSVRDL